MGAARSRSPNTLGRILRPGVGALLVVVLVLTLFLVTRDGDDEPGEAREFFTVRRFDVGEAPQDVAVEGTTAWVTLALDRAVVRLDPRTGEHIGAPQPVGEQPAGIALGFGSAWVGFGEGATVVRLDQATGTVLSSGIVSGRSPHALAVDEENVWVAAIGDGKVSRIDPNEVVNAASDIFRAGGEFPSDIEVGFERVWVSDINAGKVVAFDPDKPRDQRAVKVGESPIHVVAGDDAIFVANQNFGDGTLSRIDPESMKVTDTIEVGGEIGGLAVGEGYIWVTLSEQAQLVRVDPETNEVDGVPIQVGGKPLGVDVADGFVWIADQERGEVIRVELNAQVG